MKAVTRYHASHSPSFLHHIPGLVLFTTSFLWIAGGSFFCTAQAQTAGDAPQVTSVTPTDSATNVPTAELIVTTSFTIPDGYELTKTSLSDHVKLYRLKGGTEEEIEANVNDTGGGDAIILTPSETLAPYTTYRFEITSAVEANRIGNLSDRLSFRPFSSVFTTGSGRTDGLAELPGVSFSKVSGSSLGEGTQKQFTSLVIGPDGKLYAATTEGTIQRWSINPDGTLDDLEILQPALAGSPHPVSGTVTKAPRLIIGLTFAPSATADSLVAYISHSAAVLTNGPEWDGKLTRLSGPRLEQVQDVLVHLSRSQKDHLTNSVVFGPDGALYIAQGSNTAGGAPDPSWGNRPERLLSGAILRLSLPKMPPESEWPLDVYTTDKIEVINAAPSNAMTMSDGTYNPYATTSPLTIYASGVRNVYDLLWHSNGQLYAPANGTASGSRTPASDAYVNAAGNNAGVRRIDGTRYRYPTYPAVPATTDNVSQKDFLFQVDAGSYHGHPNPLRGEFVLNHGAQRYQGLANQEAPSVDVPSYPETVQPDPNYREPAFDFGMHKSPNGVIEYRSNAFEGALQGMILVVRFSGGDDIVALQPDATGNYITRSFLGISGLTNFDDPLDLVEDPTSGNLYVAQYDRDQNVHQQLILLRPDKPGTPAPRLAIDRTTLVFEGSLDTATVQTLTLTNQGSAPLQLQSSTIEETGDPLAPPHYFLAPNLSRTLAPGEQVQFDVTFQPTLDGHTLSGNLLFVSNDPAQPRATVALQGLALRKEPLREPALQPIVTTLRYAVDVGWDSLYVPERDLCGTEVKAPQFRRAGTGPVTLRTLARYSAEGSLTAGWFSTAPLTPRPLTALGSRNYCLLGPDAGATRSFFPTQEVFGLYVQLDSQAVYSLDTLNAALPRAHRMRVYPARDRQGAWLTNHYLLAVDCDGDGDYQDYVALVGNVQPAGSQAQALSFSPAQVYFENTSDGAQLSTLSVSTGAPLPSGTQLTTSASWLLLPDDLTTDRPLAFTVDASQLRLGYYHATVTATAPGYAPAQLEVRLQVRTKITWAYQINFQPDTAAPAGYFRDIGEPFGLKLADDQGGGALTYGWVEVNSIQPADNQAAVRNRRVTGVSFLLNTLAHMRTASLPYRDWMMALPNGRYLVNVSVGDPSSANDSEHEVEVNGTTVVNFSEAGDAPVRQTATGTEVVEVTDGLLHLTQGSGARNTKLNFVRIAPVTTIDTAQYWAEAECGVIGQDWQFISGDTTASANGFIENTVDTVQVSPPADEASNRLLLNTYVGQTGAYRLHLRMSATTPTVALWTRLDDGNWVRWEATASDDFRWYELYANPRVLQTGNHRLDISYAAGKARIDKIALSLGGAVPLATGGTATNCIPSDSALDALGKRPYKVYPNPSTQRFQVEFTRTTLPAQVSVTALTLTGQTLWSHQVSDQAISHVEVSLPTQPPGVYLLRIVVNGRTYHERIVKL
ncbi:Por secretion system C-terminal sorting domain-containing protein [Catalinimonas alkaloidigena]|uniref:Por secretion system C-terminal sorting domain-containing protein n=1 Tax=Catalinimonas alkaloidigena TaxID=1075417 RepID=A0A1G8X959_9BACT|nr:Ig-like domain-containing protein [Catalinimonas alkaloidigena]SDJ86280.1 Por secretion system C-terminal sorting domain-containing protein [Catalinimonas alkaloidigena]